MKAKPRKCKDCGAPREDDDQISCSCSRPRKPIRQEPKLCPFTFGNPNGAGKCQGKECSLWIPEGGLYTIEGTRAQGGCSLYFNPQMNGEGRVVV